jgi:hypothetical protein
MISATGQWTNSNTDVGTNGVPETSRYVHPIDGDRPTFPPIRQSNFTCYPIAPYRRTRTSASRRTSTVCLSQAARPRHWGVRISVEDPNAVPLPGFLSFFQRASSQGREPPPGKAPYGALPPPNPPFRTPPTAYSWLAIGFAEYPPHRANGDAQGPQNASTGWKDWQSAHHARTPLGAKTRVNTGGFLRIGEGCLPLRHDVVSQIFSILHRLNLT